jgi:3-oxoacyl-[acyl-carrier protein] reductase
MVAIVDRDGGRARDTASELGPRAFAVEADVSNEESCARMGRLVAQRCPRIDVVVTAAGISFQHGTPALELSIDHWRRIQDVNLFGTLLTLRALVPHMSDGGSIVTVASGAARRAAVGHGAYSVSKAGVWMLTKVLALELGDRGIRVNAVAPGFIETEMTSDVLADPAVRAAIEQASPLGRIGVPDEIAATVMFLAGDGAGFLTGEIVVVDGGASAPWRP